MRMLVSLAAVVVAAALLIPSVGAAPAEEPEVVVVQHILIGFGRSVRGKKIDRTKAEARELAEALLQRAQAGEESFDELVRQYTDDQHPGIYTLTNRDAPRRSAARTRDEMVPRFGDLAFSLEVGEVGLVHHHGGGSPYGWHVIKRLK